MATVSNHINFNGTIGSICFYRMGGEYYARMKSSLTGKRVKKDPAFKRTMENANQLARASKIGSMIYQALPKDFRRFWMYRSFTGEALKLLKAGNTDEEVKELLWKTYVDVNIRRASPAEKKRRRGLRKGTRIRKKAKSFTRQLQQCSELFATIPYQTPVKRLRRPARSGMKPPD